MESDASPSLKKRRRQPLRSVSASKRQKLNQPNGSTSTSKKPDKGSNDGSPSIPKGPNIDADLSASNCRDQETEEDCSGGEIVVLGGEHQGAIGETPHTKGPRREQRRPLPHRDYPKFLRHDNRVHLTRLLRNFMDCHDWDSAASTLSVLLRFWPDPGPLCSITDLRKNFNAALELHYRQGGSHKSQAIKQTYETWLSRLNFSKGCAAERHFGMLELVLFLMQQCSTDAIRDLYHISKGLMQDKECPDDPKLPLIHGLICYWLWYCGLPKELKLESFVDSTSELFQECTTGGFWQESQSIENLDYHPPQDQVVEVLSSIHSDASIHNLRMNSKKTSSVRKNSSKKVPIVLSDDPSSSNQNRLSIENPLPSLSIFSSKGLDKSLLPMRLVDSSEAIEERIYAHRQLLNEHYHSACDHLRKAVFAAPPVIGALLPYLQVLLLGDLVEVALSDLDRFCKLSNTTLPFRLKGRLLEVFCQNKFNEISSCHETVLAKDPTCGHTLEKLILMFKEGNYSIMKLLEMIALHLDSSVGSCKIWSEFASCLLRFQTANPSEYVHDNMSTNIIHKDSTIPNILSFPFMDQQTKRSWQLRCKWWSKHHFCKQRFLLENNSGEWELLTSKAACAAHLYEPNCQYVQDVAWILRQKQNEDALSYLEKHVRNSLGLYGSLSGKQKS